MTNEELKKKLAEIINEWHKFQKRDAHGNTIWQTNDAEKLANAFISAGIGDVKEEEHWSKVVLLALINSLSLLSKIQREVSVYIQSKIPSLEEILDQAEEELAKEAKNDGTQND